MTLYTVSKVNVLCGTSDHKISLSKGWSYANILVSTIALAGGSWWVLAEGGEWEDSFGFGSLLPALEYVLVLYIIGTALTIIFLHYDSLCCCCFGCCLGEEQVVIHDPSNPRANLVWRDGQVN